jgi:DNA/RNA non-specific endonuclease
MNIKIVFIIFLTVFAFSESFNIKFYEDPNFLGRSIKLVGDFDQCISLLGRELCQYGSDCVPAWDSISSASFDGYSCVQVYRDLDCNGPPDTLFSPDANKCLNKFCYEDENCARQCNVNDVIGSVSSCNYKKKCQKEDLQRTYQELNETFDEPFVPNYVNPFNYTEYDDDYSDDDPEYYDETTTTTTTQFPSLPYYDNQTIILSQVKTNPEIHKLKTGDDLTVRYGYVNKVRVQRRLRVRITPPPVGVYCTRTNFGKKFDARMTELGRLDADEKGHLVSSCVGGMAEEHNLLPQTRQLNRGNGQAKNWRKSEIEVATWLKKDDCNSVDWDLQITPGIGTPRPAIFSLIMRFYTYDPQTNINRKIKTQMLRCNNIRNRVRCV